jgi:hypothetical protein
VASLLAGCDARAGRTAAADGSWLVGAYYYAWHEPREWQKGHLGRKLAPPVTPLLGEYVSSDPGVAAQHVRWASDHGIDFFAVSWAGPGSPSERNLQAGLLAAPNLGDIRFALLYESLLALETGEDPPVFDEALTARLVSHAENVAGRYFGHPQYLRVGGRPVLFLYVSRTFQGKTRDAITVVRQRLDRLGHRVYLVGDEVFWSEPRPRRLRLYDAVTAYNMFDWPRRQLAGYAATSAFFPGVTAQYRRYREAARAEGTAFVPGVIPGYNDRGVRPEANHYVIPRRLGPDGEEGGFFARGLRETGTDLLDDRARLLMITSFNEWHEWSQIEPARAAPPTTADVTGVELYTLGFPHDGYGFRYLELLRDAVVAVSGRVVTGSARRGVPGVEVRALRQGRGVTTARTDSAGAFRFSRGALSPGAYELAAGPDGPRRTVTVGASWIGPVELVVPDP